MIYLLIYKNIYFILRDEEFTDDNKSKDEDKNKINSKLFFENDKSSKKK